MQPSRIEAFMRRWGQPFFNILVLAILIVLLLSMHELQYREFLAQDCWADSQDALFIDQLSE